VESAIPELVERSSREKWREFGHLSLVLVLSAVALLLLLRTENTRAGSEAGPANPSASTSAAGAASSRLEAHLFIITVGANRVEEVSAALANETAFRALLGEARRDAEVIAAEDELVAAAIAQAINDQANIPGVAPIAAMIVE
jgi:hypothetical protein